MDEYYNDIREKVDPIFSQREPANKEAGTQADDDDDTVPAAEVESSLSEDYEFKTAEERKKKELKLQLERYESI